MGQVAQVKVPLRLVRDGFKVSSADINAVGEHAKVLVKGVAVRVHADGKLDPRVFKADIRGKGGGDGYLTTKEYGTCVEGALWGIAVKVHCEPDP
jgi:hypothetical protein